VAAGGRFFRAGHPLAQRFQAVLERGPSLHLWTRFQCLGLFAEVFAAEFEQARSWGRLALTARDRFDHWAAGVSEPELRKASVEELARRCGCSARHFSRLFRARFGLSLSEARFPKGLKLERDAAVVVPARPPPGAVGASDTLEAVVSRS
jgi:AraC-like DNA-binding protein